MKYHAIFVEKDLKYHPRVMDILHRVKAEEVIYIDDYRTYWAHVHKPYLLKREKLNLYLAKKQGIKVKQAPDAYGVSGDPHYYYVHFYNCIYECEYCYLQGYFKNPDLVAFVNHEDIIQEMEATLGRHPNSRVWFHGGEFSDSLALSSILQDLPVYHDFFSCHPRALWELRTKSVNIQPLRALGPLSNLYVTFSLSPQEFAKKSDHGAPPVPLRLKAMKSLISEGFQVGVHFDPMIYYPQFFDHYEGLLKTMDDEGILKAVSYYSLGAVRFTKEVWSRFKDNYPQSPIRQTPLMKDGDWVRYPYLLRKIMLDRVASGLTRRGVPAERFYFCMEESGGLDETDSGVGPS